MYPEHKFDDANTHYRQDVLSLKKRAEERKAKKKLEAVAPQLLEACKKISIIKQWIMRIKNAPKELWEDIEEVEAAIAAAE